MKQLGNCPGWYLINCGVFWCPLYGGIRPRGMFRGSFKKVVVLEVAWDMRELVGIKSLKWWKIIVVKWLSPRVMVKGILGPLPWWSALQTHLPLPDFAWPRGFWGSFQKNLFPLVYAVVSQGVAKPSEVILWPSKTWIQVWVSSFSRYVSSSKLFLYFKPV